MGYFDLPAELRAHEVSHEILEERKRQQTKRGEQNHSNGTGGPDAETAARLGKTLCDQAEKLGKVCWRHILNEEVLEAFAETDPQKLRNELIQVAAVAQQWIECIDRGKQSG